jgi:Ca-activated chloride channel family protein
VQFQIVTSALPQAAVLKRPPIEIAVVLDRSGSMSGAKLAHSKQAIKEVIDNLTADDRFHLVVYDDHADVVIEDGDLSNKKALHKLVDSVRDRGSTNLCAGVESAMQLFAGKSARSGVPRRIFLFSDGRVNVGIQNREGVCGVISKALAQGIETASFGIGEDFDEDLMKAIAEAGNSNYFYIENADQITKYVGAALGALLNLIGKKAVLKVRGKNGATLTKIYGHPDLVEGAKIGDIKQNNIKNILTEFEFTPKQPGERVQLLSYELTFVSVERHGNTISDGATVQVNGVVEMTSTEDDKQVVSNPEVEVAKTIQKTADLDDEVVDLLEQVNREKREQREKNENRKANQLLSSLHNRDVMRKHWQRKRKKFRCWNEWRRSTVPLA